MKTNTIYNEDFLEGAKRLPDKSIDLIVTSPPYFNAREYAHWKSYDDFLLFLAEIWKESFRILKDGGRIALNTCQGYGRQPYLPIGSDITKQIQKLFLLRGHIIWDKGITGGCCQSTAWGSWLSASNPYLRDSHEQIIIASKNSLNKGYKGKSDIIRDEFLQWTESVWHINTESATRIGHPAPFPLELPKRLIKLYSYLNDLVLDPFMGSGTTAVACKRLNRYYIGFEIDKEYCKIAQQRLEAEKTLWD